MEPGLKTRIAIWHNLPSGGGKRALFDHVRGLVERGHHVEAWCPPTADASYLPLRELLEEHVVPLETTDFDRPSRRAILAARTKKRQLTALDEHARRCAAEISRGGFDLVFANACQFSRVPFIGRHLSIPNVLYLQEPYRELYEAGPNLVWSAPAIPRALTPTMARDCITDAVKTHARRIQVREERANAASFQRILVNSLFSRESLLRAYGLESKVCYLGIDTDLFRPTGESRETFVIGVGGLHRNKGVDRALRAIGNVPLPVRPRLVWVGNFSSEDEERSVHELARTCAVALELRIRISDRELVSLLSRAALMIYTSRLEPFGYAPLEANACGTPVVAIAEGGVRETVRDGVNGLVVDNAEAGEVAKAIERLIVDVPLARELGEAGRRYVEANWSLSDSIDRLEENLLSGIPRQTLPRRVAVAETVTVGR